MFCCRFRKFQSLSCICCCGGVFVASMPSRFMPEYCTGSSGTAGGTFAFPFKSRRARGGEELRREFERATFDILGSIMPLLPAIVFNWVEHKPESSVLLLFWCGRTIVFKSKISVGVISDGSTSGSGRFEDFSIWLFPTIEAHCRGSPT